MKSCRVNKLNIGGDAPPRIMGVINCSGESFYLNSFIPIEKVHETAVAMVEQGADMIDIGARSTAPNTQPISGKEEAERIDAALKELDGSGITLSVDTMHPGVLDVCLKHDIHAANDISGFVSRPMQKRSRMPGFLRLLWPQTRYRAIRSASMQHSPHSKESCGGAIRPA